MRILAAAVFAVIIASAPAYAQLGSVSVAFDLRDDDAVRQTTVFGFSQPVTENVNYAISGAVTDVTAADETGTLEHTIHNNGGNYTLEIFVSRQASRIDVSYTIDGLVFQSDSTKYFFTEFGFPEQVDLEAVVMLPEGYSVHQNSYRPANATTGSDGKRISLAWSMENATEALFLVKYSRPAESGAAGILASAAIIAVGCGAYIYRRSEQKARRSFLTGFREDEKKAILYLEQKETALQSDLQKEFRFSRAKTTRIVSVLEGKGLLEKRRYGRTNRLTWNKKTGKVESDDE